MDNIPRDFLGKMRNAVGAADGKCAVEHTGSKDESVAGVSCLVDPVLPHKVVRRMMEALRAGHGGAGDNGDDDAGNDEEDAKRPDGRKRSVGVQHDTAA